MKKTLARRIISFALLLSMLCSVALAEPITLVYSYGNEARDKHMMNIDNLLVYEGVPYSFSGNCFDFTGALMLTGGKTRAVYEHTVPSNYIADLKGDEELYLGKIKITSPAGKMTLMIFSGDREQESYELLSSEECKTYTEEVYATRDSNGILRLIDKVYLFSYFSGGIEYHNAASFFVDYENYQGAPAQGSPQSSYDDWAAPPATRVSPEVAAYKTRISELEKEKEALTAEKANLTQENESLSSEKEALTAEKASLTQKNESLSAKNETLTAEKASLTEKNSTLTTENSSLSEQVQEQMEKITKLESDGKSLQSQLDEKTAKITADEKTIADLNEQLNGVNDQLAQISSILGGKASAVPTKEVKPEVPAPSPTPVAKEEFRPLQAGDRVLFGTYEQDNNGGAGEPIEWRVLDVKDGKVLLLADKVLKGDSFHNKGTFMTAITWKDSSVRAWLNGDFMASFEADEKQAIADTAVSYADWGSGKEVVKTVNDKVFLLSYDEVKKYLPTDADRMAVPTEAARAEKVHLTCGPQTATPDENLGTCWWWLRTHSDAASFTAGTFAYVESDGTFYLCGAGANRMDPKGNLHENGNLGIRPAMWVDVEYASVKTCRTDAPAGTKHTGFANGFQSKVSVTLTVDDSGVIQAIQVNTAEETNYFGTRCAEDEAFLNQFIGKSGTLTIGKDIEALSGATVTSSAVVKAVNSALDAVVTVPAATEEGPASCADGFHW